MRRLIFALILLGFAQAQADTANQVEFKSKYDKFELKLNENSPTAEGKATVDGKPVNTAAFRELLPLLAKDLWKDLGEECPKLQGTAEVTVRMSGSSRSVYIQQGVVTDGKKCLYVSGDGLMYFPLHRSWLTGNSRDSLALGNTFKVTLKTPDGAQTVLDLKRQGKKWVKINDDDHPDWDFFEKLQNDLNDFTIKMHVNMEISKGKKEVDIESNGKVARFFHITPTLWAMQKPGTQWLVVGDWSQWFELEPSQFSDHRIEKIRIILDKTKSLDERLHELNELNTGWSRSLHEMYIRLLSDSEESPEIHKIALKRLRGKPTLESAGAMVAYLQFARDPALKKMATQALKTQYPKGRLIDGKQSATQQMEIVQEWSRWWQKAQTSR